MSENAGNSFKVAQGIQQKFEFYALGLTFTILGLSIQTAKFGASRVADSLELFGWLSLLLAGMLGLSRLENMPYIYKLFGFKDSEETKLSALKKAAAQGSRVVHDLSTSRAVPTAKVIANAEESLKRIEEKLSPAQTSISRKYRVQKLFFILGFALLLAARAYVPAANILARHG